ncbi:hypothetical protein GQE99_15730 [Maritimibacter sp. DP07]|uniref:Uncharacterized protein n=1 Tax=Maritimibacter harenae TaxID=2606218 RepID=A0A845M611_9RHOB|nr:hypothetical protein [Maritimibacter harenae]MZR14469.1 hypothetical protein [Maritimibacter harenae]
MTAAPRDGAERWTHLVFVATLLLKGALGVMLIVLSLIDIAVIGLTVHEWRGRHRQLRAAR